MQIIDDKISEKCSEIRRNFILWLAVFIPRMGARLLFSLANLTDLDARFGTSFLANKKFYDTVVHFFNDLKKAH